MPTATEHDIAWKLVDEMSIKGAELLKPIFDAHNGRNGRLSVQTDPRFYRDADAIVRQAVHFVGSSRPNIIVKIPVTAAGSPGDRGSDLSRHQHQRHRLFFAAAVRRGGGSVRTRADAARAGRQGHRAPWARCARIMVGRLDDWLKVVADKHDISVDPGVLEWAGLAVFKKTYRLFQERGYRIRLLSAAFRNHMHWSELIGGDVVISPPHLWQKRFNACDVPWSPASTRRSRRRSSSALDEVPRLPPGVHRAGALARRIRHLSADAPHAAPVHHRVPRARRPDSRADAAEPGRHFVETQDSGPCSAFTSVNENSWL